mgnify:CR=1 FL=1
MTFELSQLLAIGVCYLLALFAAAYAAEKHWLPAKLMHHPAIYVLSIGVYASTWAMFGTFKLAHEYGYGYLPYYLGLSAAFLLTPVMLSPILKLTRAYQLGSLADLFAYRYRSQWVGRLVTIFMMLGATPLLALQIQGVSDAIIILNNDVSPHLLALSFCCLSILFAILFGARHTSSRDKHEGLVIAIALESLVKVVALLALAGFALFGVFESPTDLSNWLLENQETLTQFSSSMPDSTWYTLILIFFAASVTMPHMFHMTFTENLNPNALKKATWGVPLLMLIIAIAVPPILWAAIKLNLNMPPEYFTLGLGLATNNAWLAIIACVGGLSAASGVIIVTTLALANMCLNHLILPVYQPSTKTDIYSWLLWMKRCLIATIILIAYGFYLVRTGNQNFAQLGIVAFVGTVQFLPGVIGVLFWPTANRAGFMAGLITGMTLWSITILSPMIGHFNLLQREWLPFDFELTADNWHLAALTALGANLIVFIITSLLTPMSSKERAAAESCAIDNVSRPQRLELVPTSPQEFKERLTKPLGKLTAEREIDQALKDLNLNRHDTRPYALRRLRDQIETNLSGMLGPSVAQEIVSRNLPFKTTSPHREDVHFIESRLENYRTRLTGLAAELDQLRRYHRQILQNLPTGVCTLSSDGEILMWNQAMADLTGINGEQIIGSRISALPVAWYHILLSLIEDQSNHMITRTIELEGGPHWLNLHKSVIQEEQGSGDIIIMAEDQTETKLLEEELTHSERLASIGQLAAGVAHEIGNPITGIACLAQNLEHDSENSETKEITQQILQQTQRVSSIVQSLVNFAHAGKRTGLDTHSAVNLHNTIQEAINLIQLKSKHKQLDFQNLCDAELAVSGDPQRLLQVFVNLISNANDASANEKAIITETTASDHTVTVAIVDEGCGIPRDIQEQVFEPFFTTKDPGKGTGLGLALVYRIIEEHYGKITIESPVNPSSGTGTRVIITLPRYIQQAVDAH